MSLTEQIDELLWDVHDNYVEVDYIQKKREELLAAVQQEIKRVKNSFDAEREMAGYKYFELTRKTILKAIGG